jgi:hypothetical protein
MQRKRCKLCDVELGEGDDAFFCSTICGYIYGCTFASALDAARALLLPPSPLRPG